ncbi:MAG TPA: alpha-D-glucose phosphate-specific phosphoglucomutase [Bryobacteraceae bacterium]|jgi:phosphoglucomutase|nr:alpha-D-glucose phosphate-specific phosphoglucomutase [Bryobacteraceae bacterium]
MTQISTTPFDDQRPGTSGLRKKTRVFLQPRYLENFVQSVFDALRDDPAVDFTRATLVVGGDGRYHNRAAIQTILRIAAANGFARVLVARDGILSTPAMSAVIRRRSTLGGLVLSASHNPGGIDADFGIKYNATNGGPAPESLTERIYGKTKEINRYLWIDAPDLDLAREATTRIDATEIAVIDPLTDYVALMQELFDFDALRSLFRGGFRMFFDAMHGSTGPYARRIFEELLAAPSGTVLNGVPLEDFGGGHPDPNQVYAADLVTRLNARDAPDFGAACDADGDRNMILGGGFFVTPGDSLALIAEHAREIPAYRGGLAGIARSLPTSTAADRVAESLGIRYYETPTGWKYFGNLMDAGLCTLCGEESFGTGSNHIREKDGVWAVLCWLSLIAAANQSVGDLVRAHWRRFGRSYFQRHDYEALDAQKAGSMLDALRARLAGLVGSSLEGFTVAHADDFRYTDPVDGGETPHAGIRIAFSDGSRIVCRLSGTGTEGATLRVYLERYRRDDVEADLEATLAPLARAAQALLEIRERLDRSAPNIVT